MIFKIIFFTLIRNEGESTSYHELINCHGKDECMNIKIEEIEFLHKSLIWDLIELIKEKNQSNANESPRKRGLHKKKTS